MSQATAQYKAAVRRYEIAEQRIAELEKEVESLILQNRELEGDLRSVYQELRDYIED